MENQNNNYFWISVVSFLFPLVGIILYFAYSNSNPNLSKAAGKGVKCYFTILAIAIVLGLLVMVLAPLIAA